MKKLYVAFCALALGSSATAETLTNQQIVQLSQAGLTDEVIMAKIRASDAGFELAADDLIKLKKSGVTSPVISAMLATAPIRPGSVPSTSPDPFVQHASGLYLARSDRMERLDPISTNQAKTGGHIGHALTFGISTLSIKAAILGDSARVKVQARSPTFYFFFDEASGGAPAASIWASGTNTIVSSPSQFTLARLMRKDGRREAQVGSQNVGGVKAGVMDHDRIEFIYELVRPGVYSATPRKPLEPGEYGFLFALSGNGTEGAMSARIYDFTVEENLRRGIVTLEVDGENPTTSKAPSATVLGRAPTPLSGGPSPNSGPVFKGEPGRPYTIIGTVDALVRRETPFSKPINEVSAFALLWKQAQLMGAEAVIHAQLEKPQLGTLVYQKASVKGVAVKFGINSSRPTSP